MYQSALPLGLVQAEGRDAMRMHASNWSLFLALAVTATSVATTGCKSMPGWGSMAKKDSAAAGSALAANAGEAPRYGAPPSSTSTPTPTSSQLAGRNQIAPNYLSGASQSTSPYQQASAGSPGYTASATGMQPQRGFYPQSPGGASANSGYASTSQPSSSAPYASQYAGTQQQSSYPTQPSSSGYGMPGSTSTMPAAYTASAQSGTTYGSGSSAPVGYSPAPQPYTQNSGTSAYSSSTPTQQGSVYGGSSYGGSSNSGSTYGGSAPTSGSTGYPSTGGNSSTPSYPSTSSGGSAYPSTGAGSAYPSTGSSSSYPSTSSYSASPAPNPNDYRPMTSPSYQTASATSSGGSHYRPGGTADYSGSGDASGQTTSRYGSTDYPTSTYTR